VNASLQIFLHQRKFNKKGIHSAISAVSPLSILCLHDSVTIGREPGCGAPGPRARSQVIADPWESIAEAPAEGVYIRSLFLDGAVWSAERQSLVCARLRWETTDAKMESFLGRK